MDSQEIRKGLKLIRETHYSPGSADNLRKYRREFKTNGDSVHTSAYGLVETNENREEYPIIILGAGGASSLSPASFVSVGSMIYIAIDDSVVAMEDPALSICWCTKVDEATCFGVFWVEKIKSLITWGELDIACLDLNGKIKWSFSGKDIFSEGFRIEGIMAYAVDFEKNNYEIDLKHGKMKLV